MAKIFTKETIIDEVLSEDPRYNILEDDGTPYKSDMQINLASPVVTPGTNINASLLNNVESGLDNLDTKVADANDLLTTGGTSTAYTLTTIGGAALTTGERFRVKFNATAGATPTLNRDSKGAKSLKYYDIFGAKQSCGATNIIANLISDVVYDGTDYVVLSPAGDFTIQSATELIISSDAITVTQKNHKLQPETGTSDNLSTINGTVAGQSGVLYPSDFGTDTITIKHAVGNIRCMGASDITLSTGCVFWYSNGTIVFIAGGGVSDHGLLTGLSDDDHAQYLLATGLREWSEQGSDPSTPASTKWKLYFKSGGLYLIEDTGTVYGPLGTGDGWAPITSTLTYATANSFTVSGDQTSFFTRGLRLRLVQTTTKYFQVVSSSYSVPNTTVTITAGDNYSLANAAITSPRYSNEDTPVGFPATFSWTPTFTGFSVNPTTVDCKFKVLPYGLYCEILATGGTSNANAFTITAPPGITLPVNSTLGLVFITIDNGSVVTASPGKLVSDASNRYTIQKDFAGNAWTTSGSKGARFIGNHLLP